MDGLEKRVEHLEKDVRAICTDVEVIKNDVIALKLDVASIKATLAAEFPALRREMSHSATKEDVNAMGLRIVMWNIGSILAMLGLMVAALKILR